MFGVSVFNDGGLHMEAVIRRNSVSMVTAIVDNTNWDATSIVVFLECAAGDVIDVACGPYAVCRYNTDKFLASNSFSGALLSLSN